MLLKLSQELDKLLNLYLVGKATKEQVETKRQELYRELEA